MTLTQLDLFPPGTDLSARWTKLKPKLRNLDLYRSGMMRFFGMDSAKAQKFIDGFMTCLTGAVVLDLPKLDRYLGAPEGISFDDFISQKYGAECLSWLYSLEA